MQEGADRSLFVKALGETVRQAAERTQVWLVTHSERLAEVIRKSGDGAVRTVIKRDGATAIEGLTRLVTFRDQEEED